MTDETGSIWRHRLGLLLAAAAAGVIVLIWQYGLSYLDRTPFAELRYVIFGALAIGLLSGLNALMTKFM